MKKISFIPNMGARFGHQFVEWLYGYIYCRNNNYIFYHHEFIGKSPKFDNFLNLSHGERNFNSYGEKIITMKDMSIEEYLSSNCMELYLYDYYNDDSRVYATNDMMIEDDIRNILRNKYFSNHNKINYDNTISVHIRRDDVFKDSPYWASRYIPIEYFINILNDLHDEYPSFDVRIFSSNVDESFKDIKNIKYENIYYHIDDSIENTLNYLIKSKILITSNSGISFIPTLLSKVDNIKICQDNFWLKWPKECIIKNT